MGISIWQRKHLKLVWERQQETEQRQKTSLLAKRCWIYISFFINTIIPLLGVYAKETKIGIQMNICTYMFTVALFLITKGVNNPMSINGWMDKQIVVYTIRWNIIQP